MNLQPIFNIVDICHKLGVTKAIISPGSRNAPLTMALTRHPDIHCRSVSDERSAAFIALGIAQQLKEPVILSCTSGSAAYNYAPAVAEAFYRHIPLLILTADRPPEWINQLDGQTIRQNDLYRNHIKKSFTLPVDLNLPPSETHAYRIINEAINCTKEYPYGPAHVNIPFREPFYPERKEMPTFQENIKVIHTTPAKTSQLDWEGVQKEWNQYKKKLIVAGQQPKNVALTDALSTIYKEKKVPVVGDILSNLHSIEEVVAHTDLFAGSNKKGLKESLQPDLLITFGLSTISKNLKLLLRQYSPDAHWHIQFAGDVPDTYNSLTKIIRVQPEDFFKHFSSVIHEESFDFQKQENYCNIWLIEERKARRNIAKFFSTDTWGELEMVHKTIQAAPDSINLHLANSMSVRYANFIGLESPKNQVEVFSNRGTSGIDGSNSTAVGAALESDKINLLITGDMAFFYDRNAFWHNYPTPNLRILVLNNHGGGIFRMIPGPDQLPEMEEFFETKQTLTAKALAEEFDFDYLLCDKKSKAKNYLEQFFENNGKAKILEIESDAAENTRILKEFKNFSTVP
ncbi:2-succinyl-5-enolpyruvyl-6-hydroxy-3-cyclohexene-1-carboxylic-acid synthase [Fulvivirga sp. M361]|uniref:2-succinyl-5-enolpyruvyl-6-hydroxy-3- cyclohexene-1-carboxylic-acid synthase n=1 Tax=Fulvivirga sp. M361 TaxID=2594266 RepID=UPI00117B874A|nr:2-succinyl-5-enolpyruvyl-6-hydroxy-3-cyclohexene-1-carboxylic-acid synthase [Fulvivirga sp. M361]TRX49484.1 2-succinyl-5-enolpyruvyl-6-hydroxy-3-cyclohexene-1-carboxylic-acid synthase [Fulvivirga sp. M361]